MLTRVAQSNKAGHFRNAGRMCETPDLNQPKDCVYNLKGESGFVFSCFVWHQQKSIIGLNFISRSHSKAKKKSKQISNSKSRNWKNEDLFDLEA